MLLIDYVKVIPDVLDYKFCKELIKKNYSFEYSKTVNAVGEAIDYKEWRNCSQAPIYEEDDGLIFKAVGKTIQTYLEELDSRHEPVPVGGDSGYTILKYEMGEFYKRHADDDETIPRRLSVSIAINEEYDGGEFQFFDDYKIKLNTGEAVVFPSNFCFPHEILPIKSGTRYSIITWIF